MGRGASPAREVTWRAAPGLRHPRFSRASGHVAGVASVRLRRNGYNACGRQCALKLGN